MRPADVLEISAADAASLQVADGDRVAIVSQYGRAELPATISAALSPGQLFATFHTRATFLNHVTSNRRDPIGTPEYKITAVRIEPVGPREIARA